MVRLFNLDKNNIGKVKDFAYKVMHLQELVTHVAEYNHPENIRPCVYAMWHENQCACYGLSDKGKSLTYFTTGQKVPHYLEQASVSHLLMRLSGFNFDSKSLSRKFDNFTD